MAWKQDPNDSSKIVPDVPSYLQPSATTPASGTIQPRPSYVIVKNDRGGVQFNFEATGAVGTVLNFSGDTFADGYVNTDGTWVNFGNTLTGSFNISPTAWSGSGATQDYADGDVIFVYNDGRIPS